MGETWLHFVEMRKSCEMKIFSQYDKVICINTQYIVQWNLPNPQIVGLERLNE